MPQSTPSNCFKSLGSKHEALGSYRAPRASTPCSILWASLCVALLTVRRFVEDFTAQIWESVTISPLTDHQSCPHASTTRLGTLQEGQGQRTLQSPCVNSTWQILFPHRRVLLAILYCNIGEAQGWQSQGKLPIMMPPTDQRTMAPLVSTSYSSVRACIPSVIRTFI